MNSSKPLVSINGVSKCFPGNTDLALDNVSATILKGKSRVWLDRMGLGNQLLCVLYAA